MSEEEKKAIEWLKKAEFFSERLYAPIILNLIDKQQKEIEEKTTILLAGAEKVKQLEKEIKELKETNEDNVEKSLLNDIFIKKNYISKDKIREIIGKYIDIQEHKKYTNQELYGEDLKNMINELLEEER